eukprot:125414_1
MGWDFCAESRYFGVIYFDYILPVVVIVVTICMIPPVFVYCTAYMKEKLKSPKRLFYAGLALFITIFVTFIGYIMVFINYCHNKKLYALLVSACNLLYAMQTTMLLQILFYRLFHVFKDTMLAFSKYTIVPWISYTVLFWMVYFIGFILYFISGKVQTGSFIISTAGGLVILATIWLVSMFIYKLIQAHKLCQSTADGRKLVNVVTKTSLLCFISTFNIMLTCIVLPLVSSSGSIHLDFLFRIILITDMFTNFLCILLSYSYFGSSYQIFCGCCHTKCNSAWSTCFQSKNENVMVDITNTGTVNVISTSSTNQTEIVTT